MDYSRKFSKRAKAAKPNPIDTLLKTVMSKPNIISFAVGTPDTALLPVELLEKLNKQAIEHYGRNILQYGLPKGFPPLIEAVKTLLKKRGINATTETIHISTGGSGALNNACMVLLDAGDVVLVENPTYSPAVKTFLAYHTNVSPVACDEDGMLPDSLEEHLKQQPVKLIYILPTFQNPTGKVMSIKRRKSIAELAKQYDVLVIEDDVYYDLRYRGEDIPILQSFAPKHVLYLSSVSKILAPAMRVGFAVIPEQILTKFLILKHSIDMTTSPYTQALTVEFLQNDYVKTHVELLCKTYGSKVTAMLTALKTHMPTDFSWNKPEGGLFLWVTGPQNFDAEVLLRKAIESGIAYVPGNSFFVDHNEGRNTLRLSFAHPSIEKIEQGIAILAKLCKETRNTND